MDTYDRHNRIKRGVSIAAAIGVGTAAFLGRRRLVDTILHVGEGALSRLASTEGRAASLHVLTEHREVSRLLRRAESDVFHAASVSGIRSHLLSNGWEEDAVGSLFATAERKGMVSGQTLFLSEQQLATDTFATVRGSRSAADVLADIEGARQAVGVEGIWSRQYADINAQVATVREGIERSYVEQLRARAQMPQQESTLGRLHRYMGGVRSLTINEVLDDPDNLRRLGADAYDQLMSYRDDITRMGAQHLQGDFDLGAQALSELKLGNGGGIYDLRGLGQQTHRVRSWLEHNFQVPVVPFSKGFSPFSLFSWLGVGKGNFVDVVANARNQVGIADLVKGEDRLLYRVGKDLLSVDAGGGVADPIKTLHRNIAGLNSASGFGERVYRNMLESTRAEKTGNRIKDFLNIGSQLEPSTLDELRGVIGKLNDPHFADTAFQQLLDGSAEPQSLKVIANLLRREGKLTNEAASALADVLPQQILKNVVGDIDNNQALVKFLEDSLTADPSVFAPKSSALREVLNDYRESGESILHTWHPRQDNSLISLSGVLGEQDPLRGSDIVRKAIHEELLAQARDVPDIFRADIQNILDSTVEAGSDAAHHARALRVGSLMQESLEKGDYAGTAGILSSHAENATTAQYMINKHLGVLDKFAGSKLVDSSDTMLIRGSESILAQFNRSFSQGRNFYEAIGDFTSATAAGQYTSAFVQGVRDPSRLTQATLTQYFFAERVNRMLSGYGMALGPQDLGSTFDIMKGLALKRALPVFGLYEAWNYANYQGQEVGLPTPDSVVGNMRANVSRLRSHLIGGLHARQMYVGLEKYSNLKDPEEQDEQLASGYEPVRGNKFWMFGSRSELMGGKIKYFRPDRYRLNQADWEDTDEAGTGDEYWKHSIIPTLKYPLSTIKHFTDPYWWEREYAEGDNALRPYPTTGPMFTRQTPWGPLLNATVGKILKPTKVLHPEAMPGYSGPGSGDLDQDRELADYATASGDAEFRLHEATIARTRTAGRIAVTQPSGAIQARDSAAAGLAAYTQQGSGPQKSYRGSTGRSRELLRGINYTNASGTNARLEDTNIPDPIGYAGSLDDLHYNTIASDEFRSSRELSGIYGWLLGSITGTDRPKGLVMDDPSWAYGAQGRFWGMDIGGLGGEANEIIRRFLPSRPKTVDYYNPVENSYAGTWLPGDSYFENFQRGDPINRLDKGAIRLPGDAYERAHGTRTFVLDASEVGYGQEDIVSALLHQETALSAQRTLANDPALHKAIVSGWRKSGFTTKRNFEVADEDLGVKGRVDALLHFGNNVMLGDVEVLSGDRYTNDRVYDEHRDKVNFFLKQLGLKDALVAYVNADNPNDVSMHNIHYSAKRYDAMVSRIQGARAATMGRIEDGTASRADIYSNVERLEILADVAPYSQEYKSLLKQLSNDDTLTEAEHGRVTAARRRTTQVKKRLSLYPYHFKDDDALVANDYTIEGFYDANTIKVKDSDRMLRLAGVRASNERMAEFLQKKHALKNDGTPIFEQYYAHLGLKPGSHITAYAAEDENEALGGDMFGTLRVLVKDGRRNVNRQMLEQGVALERENDWSPAAIQARFSGFERMKGQLWETIAHADTPINTKLLRVRSGLEEYERSQVYGSNAGSWENPIHSYIVPAFQSFSIRNPLFAAAAGGVFGSLFGRYRSGKIALAAAGAVVAGSASIIAHARSAISGKPYIPGRVQRRRDLEEYYDKLSYLKYDMLHNYAEERAKAEEGFDVDTFVANQQMSGELRKRERELLQQQKVKDKLSGKSKDELKSINEQIKKLDEYTETTKLGPWATQALLYMQKSKRTMYGADGDYQGMMTALPKYEREIVESIMKDSTQREKDKFFKLLPDYEKRAVGMFLGKEAPEEAPLEEYFKTHQLPGSDWQGWLPQVDLNQLKIKSAKDAGADPMDMMIYPQQVDQAEAITQDIEAPTVHGNTGVMVQHLIRTSKMQGLHAARVRVQSHPDSSLAQDDINVSIDVRHDRHKHLASALERARV